MLPIVLLQLVIGSIISYFVITRLFFRRLPSPQLASRATSKQQVISGIFRTLYLFWFLFCALIVIVAFVFAKLVAAANGVSAQHMSVFEALCIGAAFMPVLIGMIVAIAASSNRAVIISGRIAYCFHIAGVFVFSLGPDGPHNIGEFGQSIVAFLLILCLFIPLHLGWIWLAGFFQRGSIHTTGLITWKYLTILSLRLAR